MLKSHYAPIKPMIIGDIPTLLTKYDVEKVGILSFKEEQTVVPKEQQVVLSSMGSLSEAAQRLFAGMRYLDNLSVEVILAELMPEEGLGRSINDRIRRAATLKE